MATCPANVFFGDPPTRNQPTRGTVLSVTEAMQRQNDVIKAIAAAKTARPLSAANLQHWLDGTSTELVMSNAPFKKPDSEVPSFLHDTARDRFETGFAGSRYFCESFFGHPCPTSGKNYATANAFGGPSRPASLVAYPTRGMQHRYRNDSTRFRKACIFTTHKALRENTCPIASGDYSTPVSQRSNG